MNHYENCLSLPDRSCVELALEVFGGCQERLRTAKRVIDAVCVDSIDSLALVDIESGLFAVEKYYTVAQIFADRHLFLLTNRDELLLDYDGRPIRTKFARSLAACRDHLISALDDDPRSLQFSSVRGKQAKAISAALRCSGYARANFALAILYAIPSLPPLSRDHWLAVARRKLSEAELVDPFTMVDPQFLCHYNRAMREALV